MLPLLRRQPYLRAVNLPPRIGLKSDRPVAACCRSIVGVHFRPVLRRQEVGLVRRASRSRRPAPACSSSTCSSAHAIRVVAPTPDPVTTLTPATASVATSISPTARRPLCPSDVGFPEAADRSVAESVLVADVRQRPCSSRSGRQDRLPDHRKRRTSYSWPMDRLTCTSVLIGRGPRHVELDGPPWRWSGQVHVQQRRVLGDRSVRAR